jgi:hypothetical protein
VVYENGAAAGASNNVIMLLWYNGLIFQQNSTCGTWAWAAANGPWNQTAFPGGFTPPATVGYTCPGVGGIWTASSPNAVGMLLTSQTSVSSGWPGPISLFYQMTIPACVNNPGNITGFTGSLAITNSTVGESPLYVSGTQTIGSDDCAGGAYAPGNTFTGSLVPASTLSLTETDTSYSVSYTTSWTFDANLYNQPSSLDSLAGTWNDTTDVDTLTISPAGVMTESNLQAMYAGCTVSGQVSIINQYYNLYSFILDWEHCPSGPYEHGVALTGLLFLDTSTSPVQLIGGGISTNDGGAYNLAFQAADQ